MPTIRRAIKAVVAWSRIELREFIRQEDDGHHRTRRRDRGSRQRKHRDVLDRASDADLLVGLALTEDHGEREEEEHEPARDLERGKGHVHGRAAGAHLRR